MLLFSKFNSSKHDLCARKYAVVANISVYTVTKQMRKM